MSEGGGEGSDKVGSFLLSLFSSQPRLGLKKGFLPHLIRPLKELKSAGRTRPHPRSLTCAAEPLNITQYPGHEKSAGERPPYREHVRSINSSVADANPNVWSSLFMKQKRISDVENPCPSPVKILKFSRDRPA